MATGLKWSGPNAEQQWNKGLDIHSTPLDQKLASKMTEYQLESY
jgi:hypothetical protein